MKKVNCQLSETHILYRFITHRIKYFKPLFLDILMIMALQIMKTQNSVSQTIRILHNINKKRIFLNRNVRLLKSMFISMNSILGWGSFCMNYCINAAWHEGDQPVTLLRCNEDQIALIAAFRSSALLGLVSLIFLLTIHHRFSMEFRSGEFAGQSRTVTPWSLNQLSIPFSISIKLVSRRKNEVL